MCTIVYVTISIFFPNHTLQLPTKTQKGTIKRQNEVKEQIKIYYKYQLLNGIRVGLENLITETKWPQLFLLRRLLRANPVEMLTASTSRDELILKSISNVKFWNQILSLLIIYLSPYLQV